MSEFENNAKTVAEAEATLRLVAQQPPPDGLTGRVHQRLGRERILQAEEPEGKGFWRLWLPAHRIQFAGAAALAGVIAVSMLMVRHPDGKPPVAQTPIPAQDGAFRTGALRGHPTTLKPIPVPQPQSKKKKPSAAHVAKRPSQSSAASETKAAPVAP